MSGGKRRTVLQTIVELLLLMLIIAVVVLRLYVFEPVRVRETSMEPTLHEGDVLLINRWKIRHALPARGTIVVLEHPRLSEWVVKRVVAVENDQVAFDRSGLWLNGKLQREPYAVPYGREQIPPVTVPPDHVYVVGDNRPSSEDSRDYQSVPREKLVGEVVKILRRAPRAGGESR